MKKRFLLPYIIAALLALILPVGAKGEASVVTVFDEQGQRLFSICQSVSPGDEYISGENILYRIERTDGQTASAVRIGMEAMPDVTWLSSGDALPVFAGRQTVSAAAKKDDGKKLIAMYVTHSDESYVPTDGTQSVEGQGGIYDVARAFRDALQAKGVDVILDESTHLPHDSGAYRRSRVTAERLLQKRPDAIIDIHRDGIPDQSEYACTIDGEKASQVRLLVGRGNQNSQTNRAFAKQIKAVADKEYPGLIKDIFIGKGTYNQDLSPNAILLEFGTHTISKERVLNSTDVMAHVVSTALYGKETGSAKGAETPAEPAAKEKDKSAFSGIVFLILLTGAGIVLFAFIQTGSAKGAAGKIGRNMREMTGGLIGKKNSGNRKKPNN